MSATDVPSAASPSVPPPVEPVQPELDDCCNRGCYPCVFDVYDEAMDRYRAALKIWEKQNPAAAAKRKAKPK
jgi:hypothetical protein